MSLITASNLSKSFGSEDLFSGVSFSIPPRARIAIVGANGIGKTTLLRILVGEDAATSGDVAFAKGISIGYLPQESSFEAEHSLWQECLGAFADLRAEEARLAEMEAALSTDPANEELLENYGRVQAAFELAGGYTYETRIRQALTGLGFAESEYEMPLVHLSGGQRTRALLARLLLSGPDLLVMDEPTNHLDIKAIEWLESYFRDWGGAALIVSHDRYFLDRVVDHVWEMRFGGIEEYRGNYSAYLDDRQRRWEDRLHYVESERERMFKELEYVRRNISRQRSQQAKGKLARLSRQIRAIEQHGFEGVRGKKWSEIGEAANPMKVDEAYQRLSALHSNAEVKPLNLSLHMRAKGRSGNYVLLAENAEIGYPGNPLFTVEELELRRLECAALIGPNGAGKTTFLRTLIGERQPLSGKLKLGSNLKVGYFAQAHEDLDPNLTLIEEIGRVRPQWLPAETRKYLGRFLFSGDDHFKRVGVLSGGERGRLALAKLALTDANLLLLDEPTNHLDIPSQEVLQTVLADYDGTIILVSHDRYLIDALGTQIWEIDDDEASLAVFKGTYSEYRAFKEGRLEPAAEDEAPPLLVEEPQPEQVRKPKPLSKYERQRLEARIGEVEETITRLELELVALSKQLENPPSDPAEIQRLGEEYAYVESDLEQAMQQWEELHVR